MKSGKLQYCLFLLGFFPLVFSCSITGNDKDTIIQVEKEFAINIIEQLGTNRQLFFELESIEIHSCLNSTIDRTVIVQSDNVTLLLNGIEPATDCNPGDAPATSVVNAGTLSNGQYNFLVTTRNTFTDEGKLTVEDDRYVINMLTTDGISIVNNTLYRIPNNTIWGYIAYDDENLVGDAPQQFYSELESLVEPISLGKGYYGAFQIESGNELILKNNPESLFYQTFFYQFNGTDAPLIELLEKHRTGQVGNNMELVIFTSKGTVL